MPSRIAKHTKIAREIRSEIASGKYGTGGRLPSEAQLVSRFGMSRPTAAQALRTLEHEGLVERRPGSGTFVTRPPATRSALQQLGLIVPGLGHIEIFEVICGELASLARVHDFGMHWGGSTHSQPSDFPSNSVTTGFNRDAITR